MQIATSDTRNEPKQTATHFYFEIAESKAKNIFPLFNS